MTSSNRRLSSSSNASDDSISGLATLDSASALILVQDSEDSSNTPFDFSSDDEDDESSQSAFEVRRASIPPLAPSAVFLYLLSPYLKLGALLLPHAAQLPPKYSIPTVIFFAVLSAFSRQIWYMLSRYLRATDTDILILDVFARGRNKETWRDILRGVTRACMGVLRLLVASIYLRESVKNFSVFPNNAFLSSPVIMTTIFATVLIPLCAAQSLGAKRIILTNLVSIAAYVLWLGFVAYAYTQGTLDAKTSQLSLGTLWKGTTMIAFAFTSSSTIPLYASLRAAVHPVTTTKPTKSGSFKILNLTSATVAVALVLPLVFFSGPRQVNVPRQLPVTVPMSLTLVITWLNAITLLSTIPSIVITTPAIPFSSRIRRYTTLPVSKIVVSIAVFLVSLAPTRIWRVLSDVLLVLALSGTYFLPALVHLTTHYIRRPLSIVIPPNTPVPTADGEFPSHDELLQRKERALQRRQLRKRIIWDIGVGVLLVPVGGGGTVWAIGRVAQQW